MLWLACTCFVCTMYLIVLTYSFQYILNITKASNKKNRWKCQIVFEVIYYKVKVIRQEDIWLSPNYALSRREEIKIKNKEREWMKQKEWERERDI